MTDIYEWQGRVGETWATEWRRTDRSFGALTEQLLTRLRQRSFSTMLDIGCGAGELTLAMARSCPERRIIGVDISPQLLEVARQRGAHLPNARFELADAAKWQPDAGVAPDMLASRHGVMFFDDPPAAFANLASIAAPAANMLFSCFRSPKDNPVFTEVGRLLPDPPQAADPYAPGPFAFADRTHTEGILRAGGWTAIEFEPFDFAMVVGAGEDPVEDALHYFASIGPAAAAAREMDLAARSRFFDRVHSLADDNCRDGLVTLRASCWLVSAQKA